MNKDTNGLRRELQEKPTAPTGQQGTEQNLEADIVKTLQMFVISENELEASRGLLNSLKGKMNSTPDIIPLEQINQVRLQLNGKESSLQKAKEDIARFKQDVESAKQGLCSLLPINDKWFGATVEAGGIRRELVFGKYTVQAGFGRWGMPYAKGVILTLGEQAARPSDHATKSRLLPLFKNKRPLV